MLPNEALVRISPAPANTTIAPFSRVQVAGPPFTASQRSRFLPSNTTSASEGMPPAGAEITGGIGAQRSVSVAGGNSGTGVAAGGASAANPAAREAAAKAMRVRRWDEVMIRQG